VAAFTVAAFVEEGMESDRPGEIDTGSDVERLGKGVAAMVQPYSGQFGDVHVFVRLGLMFTLVMTLQAHDETCSDAGKDADVVGKGVDGIKAVASNHYVQVFKEIAKWRHRYGKQERGFPAPEGDHRNKGQYREESKVNKGIDHEKAVPVSRSGYKYSCHCYDKGCDPVASEPEIGSCQG